MAEKKFSTADKVFLIVLLCGLLALFGCASSVPREDSNHYVVQTQSQGYPCPECGFPIPDKDVSPNIRIENKCSICGEIFFGKSVVKKSQEGKRGESGASPGLKSHGPRSVFESDANHQVFYVGGGYFEETETGYSYLDYSFLDRKVKIRRVIPHWRTTRYRLGRR